MAKVIERLPPASHSPQLGAHANTLDLRQRFASVRAQTMTLAEPLTEADCQVQSMPETSPTKWHLAHVTWFFETFVLERFEAQFQPFHPAFRVLFNSYYQAVGEQHARPQRGLITRPNLAEVMVYRAQVDTRINALLHNADSPELRQVVELGLHHEQQHQELILTDIKHLLSCNPLQPVYRATWPLVQVAPAALDWVNFAGGVTSIGKDICHQAGAFGFDNEGPRHRVFLQPYGLANRLVTHGEWLAFVEDGGYRDPRWWMSAGWDWVQVHRVEAPLYWQRDSAGTWTTFTLHGRIPLDRHTPVVHLSWFEADAYTRWLAAQQKMPLRLPTEAEWENAAQLQAGPGSGPSNTGNFLESAALHPLPLGRITAGAMQLWGDVWEWTGSSYSPYPGFRAWAGAVGEYNGKFMVNQTVLRGGSCATPRSHIRAS